MDEVIKGDKIPTEDKGEGHLRYRETRSTLDGTYLKRGQFNRRNHGWKKFR